MTTTDYTVSGMTCEHCISAVTAELTALPGVLKVVVDLVSGGNSTVTVRSTVPLSEHSVRDAVDEAGYLLAPVRP